MIYLDLPGEDLSSVGLVSRNLSRALATLAPVQPLRQPSEPAHLTGSLLQKVLPDFQPLHDGLSADRMVAFPVFTKDVLARSIGASALKRYDAVGAASSWAEKALRQAGVRQVTTIPHGVDHTLFNPVRARRGSGDGFRVFSGGKFELRKGQDIVVRAFKVFADRHEDAVLVAAWTNHWPQIAATMSASPHFPFQQSPGDPFHDALRRWLVATGLDLRRIEILGFQTPDNLASVYGATDLGLFPNRCEGATNLVLMEYMACARAAIVSDFAGHRDIVTDANGLPLRSWRPTLVPDSRRTVACWCEPDIDEIVACLEDAYRDRERLRQRGVQAALDMAPFTWERAARGFLRLLSEPS